jgi:hypothetical protein
LAGATFTGAVANNGGSTSITPALNDASNNVATTQYVINQIGYGITLAANANLYVATTGNDNNSGTSASPYLTIQAAVNAVIYNYNVTGFGVTINVAAGSYAAGCNIGNGLVGLNSLTINGAGATTIINAPTGFNTFAVSTSCRVYLSNMRINSADQGGIYSSSGSYVTVGTGVTFGACPQGHMIASLAGVIRIPSAYTIAGSAEYHLYASYAGIILNSNFTYTVTVTGTLTFTYFAYTSVVGSIILPNTTYSAAVTGTKYSSNYNSVIYTLGGANYFPGGTAGNISNGGIYV